MIPCHDALTVVPFSVPVTSTVNVSGGGAALQTAITAAGPGTNLIIQDSLAYNPVLVTGKTNLTISVAAGQTPTITATPGMGNSCIKIQGGNSGLSISGMSFIGSGNGGGLAQQNEGLINGSVSNSGMASIDRVIIQNCTFQEGNATVLAGAPAIQILGTDGSVHQNVWILGCVATNCGSNPLTTGNGYGTIEVSGFTNVYIQNSEVTRNATLPRASSNMRGFTWKSINVILEDCLASDIGDAGSCESFKQHSEAPFGTAVGPSSLRNCVAYNAHRGFRINLAGGTMTCTACVVDNDTAGIAAGQDLVQNSAGTMSFTNGIISGAGDGIALNGVVTENHNNVFNVASTGNVLDPTDLTINPVFEDVPNGDWLATAPALQTAASDGGLVGIRYQAGTKIIWCNH